MHGWVYFVYLLATLNLAVKVRWPLWTTVGTLLAGTIPLLGIILEHFRTKQVKEKFNLQGPAETGAAAPAPDPGATERPVFHRADLPPCDDALIMPHPMSTRARPICPIVET